MSRGDEVTVTLNNYEQRILVRGLSDVRNLRISENQPTEDLDDLMLKVIDAPSSARKRRRDREER